MFKKFSWAHGVILALLSFIAFILFMIFSFSRGWQNSEMISDNYYEDELMYQKIIDAKNNLDKKEEKPKYEQSTENITVTFPTSYTVDAKKVDVELFRTDDSNLDVKKQLELNAANQIIIPKTILMKGSYTLKLKWSEAKTPYQIDYLVEWK